jgi:catechol 2,3-dioxygenase-like lactoylglutathione lyase family enzyme
MAIIGAHAVLYTPDAEAVRAFLRDVLDLDHVDAGDGWLIFRLPPAEVGVHPGEDASHQLSLMCDDIEATMAELEAKGVRFNGPPQPAGFGLTTMMLLPGDVEIQLYQPRHPTAI